MPPWGPTKRRDLVSALKRLGFSGPFSGGKHQFMVREDVVLAIPNPHHHEIGVGLLAVVLRQGGVSKREWESV